MGLAVWLYMQAALTFGKAESNGSIRALQRFFQALQAGAFRGLGFRGVSGSGFRVEALGI